VRKLRANVPNFEYLETRGWYNRERSDLKHALQAKMAYLVDTGYAAKINIIHGDFYDHIDDLCAEVDSMLSFGTETALPSSGIETALPTFGIEICPEMEKLCREIRNFSSHLVKDGKFCGDYELVDMLLYLVDTGYAKEVDVTRTDLHSHLGELCDKVNADLEMLASS